MKRHSSIDGASAVACLALVVGGCGRIGYASLFDGDLDGSVVGRDGAVGDGSPGDGSVVRRDGAVDDGSPGDGSIVGDGSTGDGGVATIRANVVFVSSLSHPIIDIGVSGADAACKEHALAAGFPPTDYVAWLSTSLVDAWTRLSGSRGWVRPDGLPFVDSVDDLRAGRVYYPPRITDTLQDLVDASPLFRLATGTQGDGTVAPDTCSDWTSTTGDLHIGSPDSGAEGWTFEGRNLSACGTQVHFYCFGVGRNEPVAVAPHAGRRAFVSSPWSPSVTGSVADADARCADDATTAGLSGTFLAMLADDGVAPISRLDLTGLPWHRSDGVSLALTTADFAAGRWLASLDRDASGSFPGRLPVWTGSISPDGPGEASTTCSGWTSASRIENGHVGNIWRSSPKAYFTSPADCDSSYVLYCLEQ